MLQPEFYDVDKALANATEQQLLEALLSPEDPTRARVRHDAPWRPDVSHLDDAEEGSAGEPIDLLQEEEDTAQLTAPPAAAADANLVNDGIDSFILQPSLGAAFFGQ